MKFKILGICDWADQTMPRKAEIQPVSSGPKCWVFLYPLASGLVSALGMTEDWREPTNSMNLFVCDNVPLKDWCVGMTITTVYDLF